MVVTSPVACGGDGAPPSTWRDARSRVLAILNGLAAACFVAGALLNLSAAQSFEPDLPEGMGIIGGTNGPTAVWYTSEIPSDILWRALIVVMLATLLAVNAVVLWRPPKAHQ